MSEAKFGRVLSVLALVALLALVVALFRLASGSRVQAAAGQPVLFVMDERDADAKKAEPSIYVLWPGQRKIEAYSSSRQSFVTYDFVTRKVTCRDADID